MNYKKDLFFIFLIFITTNFFLSVKPIYKKTETKQIKKVKEAKETKRYKQEKQENTEEESEDEIQLAFPKIEKQTKNPKIKNDDFEEEIEESKTKIHSIYKEKNLWIRLKNLFLKKPIDKNFDKWIEFVENDWLTQNINIYATIKKREQTLEILNKFIDTNINLLENKELWENKKIPEAIELLNKKKNKNIEISKQEEENKTYLNTFANPIIPLSEKIIIPQNGQVYVFGDIHGNFDAIKKLFFYLINKKVINKKLKIQGQNYFIFLGDYVDRGQQGLETLLTLFKLKIQNPEKVILIRGNHENHYQNTINGFITKINKNIFLVTEDTTEKFTEKGEILKKLEDEEMPNPEILRQLIYSILLSYELMPATVFLGYESDQKPIQFIELSHAAIEYKYDPKEFLSQSLSNNNFIQFSQIKLEKNLKYNSFINLKNVSKEGKLYYFNHIDQLNKELSKIKEYQKKRPNIIYNILWSDISTYPPVPHIKISTERLGTLLYSSKFIDEYFNKISSDDNKIIMLIR